MNQQPKPTIAERLEDLLEAIQNEGIKNEAPAKGGTEKDPLLSKSGSSGSHSALSESDDDFEDIMREGRPPPPPEPHEPRAVTNAGTFFHLLKAYFSPALLTMPKAMSHLGLVPGVIGIFLLGILFTYCIHVLLQINRAIVNRVAIDRKIKEVQDLKRTLELSKGPSINSDPKDTTSVKTQGTKGGKSKKEKKNKDPKNWKLRFAPDFEKGESSTAQPSSTSIEIDTLPPKQDETVDNMLSETLRELWLLQNKPEELTPGRTLHYDKLIALSFHYGSKDQKWLAKPLILLIQVMMYLTHYGCCCVCFLFTAESLGELATKGPFTHSNSFEMVAYAVPFIICISFIPDRHEMTAVTTIAFLLQLCGLGFMVYYFFNGEHSTDINLYGAPKDTWYLYFGLVFYAFEGTGVSMHVESHMARRQDFLGWRGILNRSMYLTIPMYAIVGGLGYWKYGNEVKTSVTFNLPEEHIPDMIQILVGIGVLLTYPFHMSFLLKPLKKLLIDDSMTENCRQMLDISLRCVFVVSTYLLSALVPYLELQLSVLGAMASSFLVLFMPAFMSINSYTHLPALNYGCCRMLFHVFIMLLGISGSLLCSYMNFKNAHFYYP